MEQRSFGRFRGATVSSERISAAPGARKRSMREIIRGEKEVTRRRKKASLVMALILFFEDDPFSSP
jgi:hypothetical protein